MDPVMLYPKPERVGENERGAAQDYPQSCLAVTPSNCCHQRK
jgi:hypothetical protein